MDRTLPDHVRALVDEIEHEVGEDGGEPAAATALAVQSTVEDAVRESWSRSAKMRTGRACAALRPRSGDVHE
jgi:hypothetical protein